MKKIKKEIKKIIITNKKTQEGYYQFSMSGQWRILEDKENNGSSTIETLYDLIKAHSDHYCHNNDCDADNRLTKYIAIKNYNKKPSIYKLQKYEYIIDAHHANDNIVYSYLFDLHQKTFRPLVDINKIIIDNCEYSRSILYWIKEFDSIDITLVRTILYKLLKNNETIMEEYRIFCKSIICNDQNTHIFYDNSNKKKLLTEWLTDMLCALNIKYYKYYEKDITVNKKDLIDVRLVIIYSNYITRFENNVRYYETRTKKQIEDIIEKLQKNGINKIIVESSISINNKDSIYDYKSYLDYIYENEEYIKSFCHVANPILNDDLGLGSKEYEYKSCNYDDIFYKKELLFTHFLKYIVS